MSEREQLGYDTYFLTQVTLSANKIKNEMIIKQVPSIDFNKCQPERCDHGICVAGQACPHKAFFQEKPCEFPMHNASMCVGCGSCSSACPLKAIRML